MSSAPSRIAPSRIAIVNAACGSDSWAERNRLWLTAAMAALHGRLAAVSGTHQERAVPPLELSAERGFRPAFLHCAESFGLSHFERELLLLVAGLELHRGLRAVVARLNGGASAQASFGLAMALLAEPHWDALSPQAPLRYWRLLEPEPRRPLVHAELRIDERVLHFLTGVAAVDERLQGIARYASVSESEADESLVRRIACALDTEETPGPVVSLRHDGASADGAKAAALAAAGRCGRAPLWIASADLPDDAAELDGLARIVDREAALSQALPVVALGATGGEAAASLLGRLVSAALWLGPPSRALAALPQRRSLPALDVPRADAARRRAALVERWRLTRPELSCGAVTLEALGRAATQFCLAPAALDGIALRLEDLPTGEHAAAIWSAAREAVRGGLDELAQRIVTGIGFEDLVLPAAHLATLKDIARQLRQAERVYGDWGFGEKQPRGQGLTALFAGESGTGKTLAAEAIANDVNLDLYRVDLASLVSKYIGETEKNLKRLFDAAEASGAVLLFDEADALFGKRSEVKDSHDRYANIEIAYLLQRLEAYRGLAILTTNMKSAVDRAFLRRIRFVVNFPFPDATARERIWRLQFPPRAPLGEVDFSALAQLNLAGGHIRNIALDAAFRAAEAGAPIGQELLIAAARAEFAKLERSFSAPGLGRGDS